MSKTLDSINDIVNELVNPNIKLKNEKLKEWVGNELNGFKGKAVPQYRKIPCLIVGNLIQPSILGSRALNNHRLPIEYLRRDIHESLKTVDIVYSVTELEHLINK